MGINFIINIFNVNITFKFVRPLNISTRDQKFITEYRHVGVG